MAKPRKVIDWAKAEKLAQLHCSISDMAELLKCHADTLNAACKREFKMPITAWREQKQAAGRLVLRDAQLKLAQAGNPAMLIWLGKQWLGQTERREVQVSGAPGGTPVMHEHYSREEKIKRLEQLRAARQVAESTGLTVDATSIKKS